MLPLFIAYYHLARLGLLLGVVAAALTFYAIQICVWFIFVVQVVGHSLVLQATTYVALWLLLSFLIFWAHLKASDSHAIRDVQRLMRLSAGTSGDPPQCR